ncbi:MAG: hypothetical protein QOJ12_2382 [Thermoleophilales bacterium]|jgi:hypothetical protein|nr:hypothetical protein [Thermoleophilales bacterium]
MRTRKLAALGAAAIMALSAVGVAQARQGADDPAGHVRHGNGRDDAKPHFKHGSDDRAGHRRHGHGRDDGPNHR